MNDMVQLTLSADKKIVEKAERLAQQSQTTVSALFAKFVEESPENTQKQFSGESPKKATESFAQSCAWQALGQKPPEDIHEFLKEAFWDNYMAEE